MPMFNYTKQEQELQIKIKYFFKPALMIWLFHGDHYWKWIIQSAGKTIPSNNSSHEEKKAKSTAET